MINYTVTNPINPIITLILIQTFFTLNFSISPLLPKSVYIFDQLYALPNWAAHIFDQLYALPN